MLSHGPYPWFSNEKLCKYSIIILSLLILYGIIITFINAYFNLWSFNIYTVCYIGPEGTDQKVAFNVITVLLPVIVLVISSCSLDLSCFVFLQQRRSSVHPTTQPNSIPQGNSLEIPLRATIISTLLFIPYILIYIILGTRKLDPLEKYFFVIILTRIQDTLRNPLIAKFLFNINDQNRQRNALEERERKRQEEIQDAMKRRQGARTANVSRYEQQGVRFTYYFDIFQVLMNLTKTNFINCLSIMVPGCIINKSKYLE